MKTKTRAEQIEYLLGDVSTEKMSTMISKLRNICKITIGKMHQKTHETVHSLTARGGKQGLAMLALALKECVDAQSYRPLYNNYNLVIELMNKSEKYDKVQPLNYDERESGYETN